MSISGQPSPSTSGEPSTRGGDRREELDKFLQLVRDGEEGLVTSKLKNQIITVSELNKPDANNLTATQYAVLFNKPIILKVLLEHEVDTDVRDKNGLSLAHHAAKIVRGLGVSIEGNEQQREDDCLSYLIKKDPTLMYSEDKDGQTPMHYAVMSGNMGAVRLLHGNDDRKKDLIYKGDNHHMTPLHVAASYGQYDIAEYLLDNDAGYMKKDKDRNTPLHYACATGNTEMTELLLNKAETHSPRTLKEFVDSEDTAKNTCLHLAAENGHVKVVEVLINKDASVMVHRKDGMFPIHLAITAGKLDIVKMLSKKVENYSVENNANSTPLHIAAEYSRVDIAEYILEKQKDVLDKQDKDGNTPLHKAAQNGHNDMVVVLMGKGSNIKSKNIRGRIPLHLAAERGQTEAFDALLSPAGSVKGSESLHLDESTRKKIEENLQLLSKTQDPHSSNKIIETIATDLRGGLHGVIPKEKKLKRIVKMVALAQTWSNAKDSRKMENKNQPATSTPEINVLPQVLYAHTIINTEDVEVNTPLHLAAKGGHAQLVQRILRYYYVEPNRKNDDERTPLHLAALHGRTRTAEMIVNVSPNAVFAEDHKGNTPLHLAAQAGNKNLLELLIQHKADIHHKNVAGRTALDLAATNGREEVCSLLVKWEAQSGLKYKEKDNKSPLYLACENGHIRVAQLLLKNNADVTAKAKDGDWNCLDVAIENGHRDIALLIVHSRQWQAALQNRSRPLNKPEDWVQDGKKIDTPMRRLIRKMPDVAKEVLDRCVDGSDKCDYQYIDDLYEDWTLTGKQMKELNNERKAYEERKQKKAPHEKQKKKPWKYLDSYTYKARTIKKNHPLMIMVKHERDELLQHKIVNKLIKQKWFKFGAYYYMATLLVHLLYLILLTRAIVQNKPPHEYTEDEVASIKAGSCTHLIEQTFLSYWVPTEKFIMYALIIVGAIFEFTQIYTTRLAYFMNLESYVEWVVYLLSFLYLVDFSTCSLRTGYREISNISTLLDKYYKYLKLDIRVLMCLTSEDMRYWQWSIGAFALFFSWVDLVLYLKAFTSLGLYVIMFQMVCWTFIRVFVVFFCLIAAFALGFHTLLQNQIPFRDVSNSILRSSVMFLGEIDYNDIFNSGVNLTGVDNNLIYPAATSVMFSTFLLLACIVLMNLLVGLAVDDIKGIIRKAAFRRTSMHVELVLDVEKVLFEKCRKAVYRARKKSESKRKTQKSEETCESKPDGKSYNPWKMFLRLGIWWWNQTFEEDENVVLKQIPEMTKKQDELQKSVETMNKQIIVLNRRVLKILLKQNRTETGLIEDGLEEDDVISRDDIAPETI